MELRTLAGAAFVDFFHCRRRECLENTQRVIELARTVDDPHGELLTPWGAAVAELATGHLHAARHHVSEGMTVAERIRDRYWLCGTLVSRDYVFRVQGDWQTVRESIDQGLELLPMETRLLSVRVSLEYDVGDFEQGEAYLERYLEAMCSVPAGPSAEHGFVAGMIPLVGRITDSPYRSGIIESAAQTVFSSALATPLVPAHTRAGVAMLTVERGGGAAAQEQYASLKPLQGGMLPQFLITIDRLWASWPTPWST